MVLAKVLAKDGETVNAVCARLSYPHSKGCGFYLLTKKESISADKEIILWTGAKYIQDAKLVRKELGFGAGAITVLPSQIPDGSELYVQSTSATRKLSSGPVLLRVPKLNKPAAAAAADDDDDDDGDGDDDDDRPESPKSPAAATTSTATSTTTSGTKRKLASKGRAEPPAKRANTGKKGRVETKADGGFSDGVSRVPATDDLSTIEFYSTPAGEAFAEERVPPRFLAAAAQKVFEAAHAAAQDWTLDASDDTAGLRCWLSPSTRARLWFHDDKSFAALAAPNLHFSVAISLGGTDTEGAGTGKRFIRTPDFSFDADVDPERSNYGGACLTDYPVGLLACLAHAIWEIGAHAESDAE